MTAIARPFERVPEQWGRVAALTLAGVLLVVGAYSLAIILTTPGYGAPGWDFAIYRDAAARWFAGGPFYLPEQLAGPYVTTTTAVMYPPPMLLLFVPFIVLPALLWWAIPLGIIAWVVVSWRPAMWSWPLLAFCIGWPQSVEAIWTGNPVMWIVAAMALATRYPWASVLVLGKPSLFPFALWGVRHRSWWIALGLSALVSAAFLPMWLDWVRVVLDARGQYSGLLYSLHDAPLLALPLVAWAGSRFRGTPSSPSSAGRA